MRWWLLFLLVAFTTPWARSQEAEAQPATPPEASSPPPPPPSPSAPQVADPLASRAGRLQAEVHKAYAAGDLGAVRSRLDARTVIEHNAPPITPAHPAYGVYTGPEGFTHFLENMNKVFEVTSFVSEPLYGDDATALSLVHWGAKCRNTGAVVNVDYYDHWIFNGDMLERASLLLPDAQKVESACVAEEAAWLRDGLAAGLTGDLSKLTVHPNATFVVRAPAEWPISGNYDYAQFVQQVVQVIDSPDVSFRVLGSGNSQVLVEFDYPKFSVRKTGAHPKITARNVRALAVYDLTKVETVVEVPASAPPAAAGSDSILAGNVAPTPAHTVTQVGFQVSHLKYIITASDPSLKVKKAKPEAPAAPSEDVTPAESAATSHAEAAHAKAEEKKAKKPKAGKAEKAKKGKKGGKK